MHPVTFLWPKTLSAIPILSSWALSQPKQQGEADQKKTHTHAPARTLLLIVSRWALSYGQKTQLPKIVQSEHWAKLLRLNLHYCIKTPPPCKSQINFQLHFTLAFYEASLWYSANTFPLRVKCGVWAGVCVPEYAVGRGEVEATPVGVLNVPHVHVYGRYAHSYVVVLQERRPGNRSD